MAGQKNRGFTLIEIAVVVAIMGIVAAIAIPMYSDYLLKSRRAEAKVALTGLAQLQETFYSKRNMFSPNLTGNDSLDCDRKGLCMTRDSKTLTVDGNYELSILTPTTLDPVNIRFRLQAKTFSDKQKKDTKCETFILDETNTKSASRVGGAANPECW
jgi:type IV pilus assembly protein PilE